MTRTRIRFAVGQKSFEIDAPNNEVAIEWYERLRPEFDAVGPGSAHASRDRNDDELNEPDEVISRGSTGQNGQLPAVSFGEFYQRFRPDATDVDRMLIAGFHLEETSESRTFTTAAANTVLKDQGVKVTNPSESLRRNLALRRVFKQGSREFRLSRPAGIEHLRSLLLDGMTLT